MFVEDAGRSEIELVAGQLKQSDEGGVVKAKIVKDFSDEKKRTKGNNDGQAQARPTVKFRFGARGQNSGSFTEAES